MQCSQRITNNLLIDVCKQHLFKLTGPYLVQHLLVYAVLVPPGERRLHDLGAAGVHQALVVQVVQVGLGRLFIYGRTNGIDQRHQRLVLAVGTGNENTPAAATPGLNAVALLRCKPGGDHIIDLAGHTAHPRRQVVALDLNGGFVVIKHIKNHICDHITDLHFPITSYLMKVESPARGIQEPLLILRSFTL